MPEDLIKKKDKKPKTLKKKIISLLTYLVSFGLLYYLFFVVIPTEINLSEVKSTLENLTLSQNLMMLAAGTITILTVGWTAATVLPGIKLLKATQASVVSQLTAVVLPPPADMLIRFGMYKSFGFSVGRSSIAVVLSGIARYFTVFVIPLLGLLALTVTGQGSPAGIAWLVFGTTAVLIALWIFYLLFTSDETAKRTGKMLQKIINKIRRLFRKKQTRKITHGVVDFSKKARGVVLGDFWKIAISNIVWGISSYIVLLLAVRFCGIDSSIMSNAYILLITGMMLLLNSLPIPGSGAGISETILITSMNFPSSQVQSAFTAALLLYRVYTWLWPFPVGAISYFVWRYQIRNKYI